MIMAPVGVTKPLAGVMVASPATAPEQRPKTDGRPRITRSKAPQVSRPASALKVVAVKALAAILSAATALPALNPYHPNHSMPVPTMHKTMLCG